MKITYHVLDNTSKDWQWTGRFDFHNAGTQSIVSADWSIYFCFIHKLQPHDLAPLKGIPLGDSGLQAYHVNGLLYNLKPGKMFKGISPGDTLEVPFTSSGWQVARTDSLPNWYVVNDMVNGMARTISSTSRESLDFVAPLTQPQQYKRTSYDQYTPYSAEQRYETYSAKDLRRAPLKVIPQVLESTLDGVNSVDLSTSDWIVVANDDVSNEAQYLAGRNNNEVFSDIID